MIEIYDGNFSMNLIQGTGIAGGTGIGSEAGLDALPEQVQPSSIVIHDGYFHIIARSEDDAFVGGSAAGIGVHYFWKEDEDGAIEEGSVH